jgi:hypothetical protein
MRTNITYLAAQEHVNDLRREAEHRDPLREVHRDRDHVKIRRLAVIRPSGSHFTLMSRLSIARRENSGRAPESSTACAVTNRFPAQLAVGHQAHAAGREAARSSFVSASGGQRISPLRKRPIGRRRRTVTQ